jgi:peptidoglycan/LPS O-acetylase OafA/YrhL
VWHLNAGVALFFLLSGFLLYRPFVLARAQHRTVATRAYITKRLTRILPAYWLALFALAVWPGLPGFFSGSWPASVYFLQIYVRSWNPTGLAVAWSLCAEMSFYLALPLYARTIGSLVRRRGSRQAFPLEIVVLALIALASLAFHTAFHSGSYGDLSLTLPATAYMFCGGMLLAVCSVHTDNWISSALQSLGRRRALCWLGALAAFAAIGLHYPSSSTGPTDLANPVYAVVAFLMLLPLTLAPDTSARLDRLLSSPLAAGLGAISYGVYLWHSDLIGPVASASGGIGRLGDGLGVFLLSVAAAGLAATVSYRVLERPLLRLAHRQRSFTKKQPMRLATLDHRTLHN